MRVIALPCLLEDLAEHPKRRHLLSAPAEAGCLYPLVCCGALGVPSPVLHPLGVLLPTYLAVSLSFAFSSTPVLGHH